MKKEKQKNALFYWNQARVFHEASKGLPTQSAPLLHYYSFMNAVKALLTTKGIKFIEQHGVVANNLRNPGSKISLTNEGVKIKENGILPSLSTYYGEPEQATKFNLKELLFNLPYIHRTYCLTYPSQTDMFIPIKDAEFVVDKSIKRAYFRAKLSKDFSTTQVIKRLPPAFTQTIDQGIICSSETVSFLRPGKPTATDINNLLSLHKTLRYDLQYINGAQTLWYIKSKVSGPKRISKLPSTLTLAAMHRLSELSRYKPLELDSFLSGQKNWLLSEFIQQAPNQFFDEIASEITGYQFLIPNVRSAT
ncbi:YaaC family protein [Marinibactrum sp. C21]|nr:YaaC family protein [Sessilibacter corallicola]